MNSFLNNFLSKKTSKWLVLLIDLTIVAVSFTLSYLIRFNLSFDFETRQLMYQLPLIILVFGVCFILSGSHKAVIRHTGTKDLLNIFNSICISSIAIILIIIFNKAYRLFEEFTIPLSIVIINSLLTFVALTSSRFVYKYLYQAQQNSKVFSKNILIYGAGEFGILAHNVISSSPINNSKIVGYIDIASKNIGKKINGVLVIGKDELNTSYIEENNISEIIFAVNQIEQKQLRELAQGLMNLPVLIKIIPPPEDWVNGELKASQIKKIQIEDLLDRPPIDIKNEKIAFALKGQKILVTGGAGSIGSELVRQISNYDYSSLLIVDQAESPLYDLQQELKQNKKKNFEVFVLDIRDKNRMEVLFQNHKPTMVFHAAAYKHVPLMEYNVYEAVKINVMGTKIISDLSLKHDIKKFVFVSTDKAVNPTNIMGATKRAAEMYISCLQQQSKTKFIITRFGNVLGSNGSVIPLFKRQIEKGGPLTVTHEDITRYFMTIPEASQLVLEAGSMGKGGEIFIFDMGESVRIYDLAKNMIKLSGLSFPDDIDIKITGLRPGEKLYEELLANGENTVSTYHKKIMISKTRAFDYCAVEQDINELSLKNLFLSKDVVKILKNIVPEYVSNNSAHSDLDNNLISSAKEKANTNPLV